MKFLRAQQWWPNAADLLLGVGVFLIGLAIMLVAGAIALASAVVMIAVVALVLNAVIGEAFAMEQITAYAPAYGQGPFEQLFSQVVPALGTLLIMAIPGVAAMACTIVHVTFWRRDNRAAGLAPFSHTAIRDKVYWWGRIYGVGSVAVMQGTVEYLLRHEMSWTMRGSMLVIAVVATGPASRLLFDIIRGHAAAKVEAGKNGWWRRVYDYLTVQHPEPGEDNDDTLRPRGDVTEPK